MSPNDAPCFPCGWVIGKNIKRRRRSVFAADGRVYVPGGGVASQASQVSALRCGRDTQGWGLRAEHPLGHESCRVSSAGELSRLPGSQRFRTACLGAGTTQGTGRAGRVGADGGRGRPDPGPRALQELGPVVRALLSGRPQARPCLGKRAPGWAGLRSHRKPHPGGGSTGAGHGPRWTEGRVGTAKPQDAGSAGVTCRVEGPVGVFRSSGTKAGGSGRPRRAQCSDNDSCGAGLGVRGGTLRTAEGTLGEP